MYKPESGFSCSLMLIISPLYRRTLLLLFEMFNWTTCYLSQHIYLHSTHDKGFTSNALKTRPVILASQKFEVCLNGQNRNHISGPLLHCWSNGSVNIGCYRISKQAPGARGMAFSYRLCFPHIYGRADSRRIALSSPLHFFHDTMHLASRQTVEKHRCRR